MCGPVALANLFLYCYFGKMASESYENMSESLYESNWLCLPVDLQKHFIVMIANVQRPIFYHGFKIVNMDLETFTRVREILN